MGYYLPTVLRDRHHLPDPDRPGWSLCGVIGEHLATDQPTGPVCVWCAKVDGTPVPCRHDGCTRPALTRELCSAHYQRWHHRRRKAAA